MNQKAVAREWLLFIGLLALGAFVVMPAAVYVIGNPPDSVLDLYGTRGVFFDPDAWIAWTIVFAPYVVVQLGRSVLWAAKTVRQ